MFAKIYLAGLAPHLAHRLSSYSITLVHFFTGLPCPAEVSRKSCSAFLDDTHWATKPHANTKAWSTLKTALFVVQSPGDRLKFIDPDKGVFLHSAKQFLIGPVEAIFIASGFRALPAS